LLDLLVKPAGSAEAHLLDQAPCALCLSVQRLILGSTEPNGAKNPCCGPRSKLRSRDVPSRGRARTDSRQTRKPRSRARVVQRSNQHTRAAEQRTAPPHLLAPAAVSAHKERPAVSVV
jgi:hypothetical protein